MTLHQHASDCALHNGPAYPAGDCDCGAISPSSSRVLRMARRLYEFMPGAPQYRGKDLGFWSWAEKNEHYNFCEQIAREIVAVEAVAAEREACAKVAEDDTSFAMQEEFGMQSHYAQLRAIIADAIRARGKQD